MEDLFAYQVSKVDNTCSKQNNACGLCEEEFCFRRSNPLTCTKSDMTCFKLRTLGRVYAHYLAYLNLTLVVSRLCSFAYRHLTKPQLPPQLY